MTGRHPSSPRQPGLGPYSTPLSVTLPRHHRVRFKGGAIAVVPERSAGRPARHRLTIYQELVMTDSVEVDQAETTATDDSMSWNRRTEAC